MTEKELLSPPKKTYTDAELLALPPKKTYTDAELLALPPLSEKLPSKTAFRIPTFEEVMGNIPKNVFDDEIPKLKNALSIASANDIPVKDAYDLHDEFVAYYKEKDLWSKAVGSFKAGIGSVYSSLGYAGKWLGFEKIADPYIEYGNRLRQAYIPPETFDDKTPLHKKFLNPEWWATTVVSGVPAFLSLIPASILSAYAGAGAAAALGLGAFGRFALATVMGGLGSRVIESAMEAGSVYEEALAKKWSIEDATKAANETFRKNMLLVGTDIPQLALAFSPLKIKGGLAKGVLNNRILAATGKVAAVAAMEAGEERFQEKTAMEALGESVDFFDLNNMRLNEASLIGAIFGAGLGGAGSVWTGLRNHVVNKLPDEAKQDFMKKRQDNIDKGMEESQAEIKALDSLMENKEAADSIKSSISELKEIAENPKIFDEAAMKESEIIEEDYITEEEKADAQRIDEIIDDMIQEGIDIEDITIEEIEARLQPSSIPSTTPPVFEVSRETEPSQAEPPTAELYHYSDIEIKDDELKAGQPHEQNYFGDGIYLTEKGQYPGAYEYKVRVPENLKILDLTIPEEYEKFRDKLAKEIKHPIKRSGLSLYDDLRETAAEMANYGNDKEQSKMIRNAVLKLTKGYDAIKAPYFGATKEQDSFEIVIRRERLPIIKSEQPKISIEEVAERGIEFKALTPEQQIKAKEIYQRETGDFDESERGWEGYGYHPETLEVVSDDYIPKDKWEAIKSEWEAASKAKSNKIQLALERDDFDTLLKAAEQTQDALNRVAAELERILGKENVKVDFFKHILSEADIKSLEEAAYAHGVRFTAEMIDNVLGFHRAAEISASNFFHTIKFAERLKKDPHKLDRVAYHEGWHGVEKVLESLAENGDKKAQRWLDAIKKQYKSAEDRADAFSEYAMQKRDAISKMPAVIRKIFREIKLMLERLANWMEGKGFTINEILDVFDRALYGEIKGKQGIAHYKQLNEEKIQLEMSEEDAQREADEYLAAEAKKEQMAKSSPIKSLIRKVTNQRKADMRLIREDEALNAAWKKAEQNSRIAFREGRKEEAAIWRQKMKDIRIDARIKRDEQRVLKQLKRMEETYRKSKMDMEFKKQIDSVFKVFTTKKITQKSLDSLNAFNEFFERHGVILGLPKKNYAKLKELGKLRPDDFTLEQKKELLEYLKELKKIGIEKYKALQEQDKIRIEEAVKRLIASTTNLDIAAPLTAYQESQESFKDKAKRRAINNLYDIHMEILHVHRVAEMMDGFKKGENVKLVRKFLKAERKAINEENRRALQFFDRRAEILGDRVLTEKEYAAIQIHGRFQEGAYDQVNALMDYYGFEVDDFTTINSTDELKAFVPLDDQLEAYLNLVRETITEKVDEIANLSEITTGEIFERVENYFMPLYYEWSDINHINPNLIINEDFGGVDEEGKKIKRIMRPNFIRKRGLGIDYRPRIDLEYLVLRTISAQEWYLNMQPVLNEVSKIVLHPDFRAHAGKRVSKYWENHLAIIGNKGWLHNNIRTNDFTYLRHNIQDAILLFRASTIIKQPLAVLNGISYAVSSYDAELAIEIVKEFTKTWANPEYANKIIKESEALSARKNISFDVALQETLEKASHSDKFLNKVKEKGVRLLTGVDITTAAGVRQGVYNVLKKRGLSDEAAAEEADFIMDATQGSANVSLRPHVLARGEIWRTAFTFQTFISNMWGQVIHDNFIKGIVKGEDVKTKLAAVVALSLLAFAGAAEDKVDEMIRIAIGQKLTKKKDVGIIEEGMAQLVSTVPIAGSAIEAMWMRGYKTDMIPIMGIGRRGFEGALDLMDGKTAKGLLKLGETAGLLVGIPGTSQIFDVLEAMKE